MMCVCLLFHDSFHVISFSFFTLFYAMRVLVMHRPEVVLVRLYHIDVMFQDQQSFLYQNKNKNKNQRLCSISRVQYPNSFQAMLSTSVWRLSRNSHKTNCYECAKQKI
jgi:hypothetical protein